MICLNSSSNSRQTASLKVLIGFNETFNLHCFTLHLFKWCGKSCRKNLILAKQKQKTTGQKKPFPTVEKIEIMTPKRPKCHSSVSVCLRQKKKYKYSREALREVLSALASVRRYMSCQPMMPWFRRCQIRPSRSF